MTAVQIETFAPLSDKPGSKMILQVPSQAVGASLVFIDIFTLTVPMYLGILKALKDGTVAVSGLVSVKMTATRTSTIGTGGTAAVNEGTNLAAPSLTATHPGLAVTTGLTARMTPTGGAAAGAILGEGEIYTEETGQINYDGGVPLIEVPVFIPAGTGVRVIQSSVASVGNIGFTAVLWPALQ